MREHTRRPDKELRESQGTDTAEPIYVQRAEPIRAQLAKVKATLDKQEAEIKAAKTSKRDLQKLSHDYESRRELYRTLLRQYEEAQISEAAAGRLSGKETPGP
jgi:uncharacterized protein involved in exopolysaccharide biosynthesis